jgi:hypothetical protein
VFSGSIAQVSKNHYLPYYTIYAGNINLKVNNNFDYLLNETQSSESTPWLMVAALYDISDILLHI